MMVIIQATTYDSEPIHTMHMMNVSGNQFRKRGVSQFGMVNMNSRWIGHVMIHENCRKALLPSGYFSSLNSSPSSSPPPSALPPSCCSPSPAAPFPVAVPSSAPGAVPASSARTTASATGPVPCPCSPSDSAAFAAPLRLSLPFFERGPFSSSAGGVTGLGGGGGRSGALSFAPSGRSTVVSFDSAVLLGGGNSLDGLICISTSTGGDDVNSAAGASMWATFFKLPFCWKCPMRSGQAATARILKTAEPTMVPTPMSPSVMNVPITLTNSSGAEVAAAMNVAPATSLDMFSAIRRGKFIIPEDL
uniref:Uncharacterized protein n=1 Tax=Anopheles atroparvus TaxID=41427 RepID=A0A182JFE6_ANOAO